MIFFSALLFRRPPISTPFPTRRSSDLGRRDDLLEEAQHVSFVHSGDAMPIDPSLAGNADVLVHDATRSEEHTSELQSQSNLVCRLLLEKKKNPTLTQTSPRALDFAVPY